MEALELEIPVVIRVGWEFVEAKIKLVLDAQCIKDVVDEAELRLRPIVKAGDNILATMVNSLG